MNTYPGAELVLSKLKLLDELLQTKLTKEQIELVNKWCHKDESILSTEEE